MNKILSIVMVSLLSVPVVAAETDRAVDIDGFTSVHLKGSMDVELVQAESFSVVVTTEDEWQQWVIVERDGDTLQILLDEDRPSAWFSDDPRVNLVVTMPLVEALNVQGSGEISSSALVATDLELRVDGSGDIEVTELGAENLSLQVNGSGDIELWTVVTDELRIKVSGSGDVHVAEAASTDLSTLIRGSGDVKVSGNVGNAEISIYGSGDFSGRNLRVIEADVTIYGSGDVWLDRSGDIHQTIRGSGDVHLVQ